MEAPAPADAAPAEPTEEDVGRLLAHARALVGQSLAEIADALGLPVPVGHVRTKGWSGQLIEQELGLSQGGQVAGPDFPALGLELKTVPVDGRGRPQESTAVCQIDPIAIAAESWESSTVRHKLARLLFVALEVPRGARSLGERRVAGVRLWSPDAATEALLRDDFQHVVREYFRKGRSDALTGHVGRILQVRPKGANAADTRRGYGPDGQPARVGKCGFYLRPAFVGAILRGEV